MQHRRPIWMLLAVTAFAPGTSAVANAGTASLQLEVGPGVTAAGRAPGNNFRCSDDARCVFEVPRGSTLELEATGSRRPKLRWSGCSDVVAEDRCVIVIREDVVSVSVR